MWSLSAVRVLPVLLLIVGNVAAIPILPFNETRADDVPYRLPNNTRPVTYDIHIRTDIHKQERKFTGTAVIDLEILEPSASIHLHARQINITSAKIALAWNLEQQLPLSFTYDEVTEFLVIQVQANMLPGSIFRLTLEYEGMIRTDGGGFYMQSYKNAKGDNVYLATTQFESTNARHAFPCYDEPQLRAIFRIKITHGKNYNAISNMPILKKSEKYLASTHFQSTDARHAFPCYDEPQLRAVFKISITHGRGYHAVSNMPKLSVRENEDGTTTTQFEPTTLISSYLIAFTVSDYEFTELFDRIPHRIYSKPGYGSQHEFALQTSVAVLNSLNDYLGVNYPLPKMDNVAIPAKGGAMENWGMVTYGEQYLLYDKDEATTSAKTTIATIISHEFAHQWFGDMVSPKWWTYTWLNEGFASLFEYYTTNEVYPNWDIMQSFVTGYLRNSLASDGRSFNPRPMTHYVESPAGIAGVFDYVSYGKSASVLRMFHHAFTESTFQKALHNYQEEMKYLSAEEDDLFRALKAAGCEDLIFGNLCVDIDRMLKSWTNQGGYPLVTVTRDYSKGTFTIKQEPYSETIPPSAQDQRSWWIPYNFVTSSNPNFGNTSMMGHIMPGTSSVEIQQGNEKWSNDDWLLIDKQSTAFYRVDYDDANWKLLTTALNTDLSKIHLYNRAILLENYYQYTRTGKKGFAGLFDLMSYLKKEVEYAPWVVSNPIFTTYYSTLSADNQYRTYRFFMRKMSESIYEKLGVEEQINDAHLMKIIRPSIITIACRGNNPKCIEAANQRLKTAALGGKRLEPDLRSTLMCTGMMAGKVYEMNLMLQWLQTIEVQTMRNQILSGIGCLRDIKVLHAYLNLTIDTSSILSTSEKHNIVGYVIEKGPNGIQAVIDFLLSNYEAYRALSSDALVNALRNTATRIFTEKQSQHFATLLEKVKGVSGVAGQLENIQSTVRTNLEWTNTNRKAIIDWMQKFYDDNDGENQEWEEEGGDGGDGASSVIISTSVLGLVSIAFLRTVF